MAKAAGLSVSSVQRNWRAVCNRTGCASSSCPTTRHDPRFVDKLRDVVGLHVDPPAHAIVLSVDEKSQIQALDRTQPGLPLKKGRAGTMTHAARTAREERMTPAMAPPMRARSRPGTTFDHPRTIENTAPCAIEELARMNARRACNL